MSDAIDFRSLASALQYLTFTRPELCMLFNRSAFICTTPGSLTLLP